LKERERENFAEIEINETYLNVQKEERKSWIGLIWLEIANSVGLL